MGIFDDIKYCTTDEGAKIFKETPGAVLLDVRSAGEYCSGHIPGSLNLPLDEIDRACDVVPDKNTPIFFCCLSGGRASSAERNLKRQDRKSVV